MSDAFLGLNILHDTSAAIVVDGELVCAVEEERFNRDRHTAAFPRNAIDHCLRQANLRRNDLTGVSVTFNYDDFENNSSPFDQNVIEHDDMSDAGIELIRKLNAETCLEAKAQLKEHGFDDARYFRHHLTHAACGFYLSGFPEANLLVMDGRGEKESTSLWYGSDTTIKHLSSYPVSESLGHLYTYVTSLCGLYKRSGRTDNAGHLGSIGNEGKTMGLSAYGAGTLDFSQVITFSDGKYKVNYSALRQFDFMQAKQGEPDANSRELALAVQKRLEDAYLFLANQLQSNTGSRRFVLAGGVALNCNANAVLAESSMVDHLFIPPAANDAGAAVGAAFLQWKEHSGTVPKTPKNHVYFGGEFDDAAVDRAVDASGVSRAAKTSDPAMVAAEAVASGYVVGWCQGKMEFGPRALGNRSILADPRDPSMPDRINGTVKFRESWRPFAPSVLSEASDEWFDPSVDSPFMLLSLNVRHEKRNIVPAITHVDGTARIQTVSEAANPLYHRLISNFSRMTGVPLVLNTSLNIKGEPIARTPEDALRCFTASGLDVLVIGKTVLWKDNVELRRHPSTI